MSEPAAMEVCRTDEADLMNWMCPVYWSNEAAGSGLSADQNVEFLACKWRVELLLKTVSPGDVAVTLVDETRQKSNSQCAYR